MIATITSLLLAFLQCRTYFEYVESEANAADGLSRDGLRDLWTLRQGWQLHEAVLKSGGDRELRFLSTVCSELADTTWSDPLSVLDHETHFFQPLHDSVVCFSSLSLSLSLSPSLLCVPSPC